MLLTQLQLHVMCKICCEFSCSKTMCKARKASVSVSSVSDLWNGRHPHLFHQACGPNRQTWIQWTTNFAQKYKRRFSSEKFISYTGRHFGTAVMTHDCEPRITNNAIYNNNNNGEKCMILASAILSQYTRVTDSQTNKDDRHLIRIAELAKIGIYSAAISSL